MVENLLQRDLSQLNNEEAYQLIEDVFRIFFARYKLSSSVVDVVTITKEEVSRNRIQVRTKFSYNGFVNKEDIM